MTTLQDSVLKARVARLKLRAGAPARRALVRLDLAEISLVDSPAATLPGKDHNVLLLKRGTNNAVTKTVPILKVVADEQIIVGVPLTPDHVDRQGDIIGKAAVRTAAHDYLHKSRALKFMHKTALSDAQARVVESYIAPTDLDIGGHQVVAGSWVVAVKIDDSDLWARVRSGQLRGFSIGGTAVSTSA